MIMRHSLRSLLLLQSRQRAGQTSIATAYREQVFAAACAVKLEAESEEPEVDVGESSSADGK